MIWERMKGNDRVRHCERCRFNVYDLSAMTSAEATSLLTTREGKVCVTFFRRADGRVLTKDCRGGFSERFWARMNAAKHRGMLFRVAVALSALFVAGLLTGADKVRARLGRPGSALKATSAKPALEAERFTGKRLTGFAAANDGY